MFLKKVLTVFKKVRKILLVSTKDPFIYGGDSVFINSLENELSKYFEVEKIFIPFSINPDLLEEQIEGLRKLKFDYGDLAITSRPFSYAIKHHNKIVWFMHHIRYLYDLWDTEFNILRRDKEKYLKLREKIIQYDNIFLKECKKVFAISNNVKNRLKKFNGINAEVLYPPLPNKEKYFSQSQENFFFLPSRLATNKRQDLVISALKHTKENYKLVIAGQKDEKYFRKKIEPLLKEKQIVEKLEILDFVEEEKKIELYSKCLAILFTPFDEDYGYITLEAFYSSKPVITCKDSGGPLEFVEHNFNGLVVDPTPQSIAEAMDYLFKHKKEAEKMGQNAKKTIEQKNIGWEKIIEKMTSNKFSIL